MRRFRSKAGVIGVLAILLVAITPAAVFAGGSPHFIKSATDVYLHHDFCLHADFKEAGLSSGAIETVTLKATQTITYWSINNGDKHPQAANKQTYVVEAGQSGQFTADKNGNLVGSVCMAPLTAEQLGFQVPKGQTAVLMSVIYSNVMLVDETSGASISFPGTFAYYNPGYVQ